MGRIRQSVKGHGHIRPVALLPPYPHRLGLVQGIDQRGLDTPVLLILQGIDLHHGVKDLSVALPLRGDLRHRKSNNGKAAVLADHRLIIQKAGLGLPGGDPLLLHTVKGRSGRGIDR